MDQLELHSARRVGGSIAALPDGRYEAQDVIEAVDGDLVSRCVVTVDGEESDDRLRGDGAAAPREPQLSLAVTRSGVLLRRHAPSPTPTFRPRAAP